jgi:hypothetical protein
MSSLQNGNGNGHEPTFGDKMKVMKRDGWEQTLTSGRTVRLRALEPHVLLRDGDCPDLLTPMLIRSLYEGQDAAAREFLQAPLPGTAEALAFVDAIDRIVAKSLADGTDVADLTIGEKKWIFRLALGGAELLISFRLQPQGDVAIVEEGEPVSQAAE